MKVNDSSLIKDENMLELDLSFINIIYFKKIDVKSCCLVNKDITLHPLSKDHNFLGFNEVMTGVLYTSFL